VGRARDPIAERLCEFMKYMRAQPRSRRDVMSDLGWVEGTAAAWTREFTDCGLLLEVDPGKRGTTRPKLYQLAPEWGGPPTATPPTPEGEPR
jgi:hypothetical protein